MNEDGEPTPPAHIYRNGANELMLEPCFLCSYFSGYSGGGRPAWARRQVLYPDAVAGAQPKPGPCAVVVVGGDGPAARRACGKRSRGVPHTRTVGSGRGGDRPASQLVVSGRSSRGPLGNGDAKGSPRPPPQYARSRGQPMEA